MKRRRDKENAEVVRRIDMALRLADESVPKSGVPVNTLKWWSYKLRRHRAFERHAKALGLKLPPPPGGEIRIARW